MRRIAFLLVVAVLGLAACSKLTLENYNRIKLGMTYEEVRGILGDAARCSEALTIRSCEWGDAQRGANINFVGDKVVLMSARNLR